MEDLQQKQITQGIIGNNGDKVVDRGDQRAGSDRRVDADLFKEHGDDGTHDCGQQHRYQQRNTGAAGYQKSELHAFSFDKGYKQPDEDKGQKAQNESVEQTGPGLFEDQLQFLLKSQALIDQHTDGDRQRLGADVTGHIQYHGLEGHQDGQALHDKFKGADHRRYSQAQEHKDNQPGKTFFFFFF